MKKEEKINKNIEDLEEGQMNIIKKIVIGIGKYFKETYSDHVFRKVVSIVVVLCFILNIANLPAYAKSERRAKDNKEKNEQIMESGKTDTSEVGLVSAQEAMKSGSGEGVSTMNAIGSMSEEEVDSIIEIDEEAGVIKDKTKNNAVVAVYNAEKGQVLGYAGQSDIVYYQALVNRKKALEKGEESGVRKIEKIGEDKEEQEKVRVEKTAEEIAEVKGTVIGEYKPEVTKEEEKQEESNIKGIEEEQKTEIEVIEEEPVTVIESPKTEEEVINKEEEQIIKEQESEKQETEELIQEGNTIVIGLPEQKEEEKIKGESEVENIKAIEGYEEVVSGLANQSGVSEEEVAQGLEEALAGKTEEEVEGVIGLLRSFLAQGGSIVNCAIEALGEVLNIASKGVLGLQALLVEISTGLFEKNNADLINAGESQLMTSMATMKAIMAE